MRKLFAFLVAWFVLSSTAHAQDSFFTLLPGTQDDYRFDYKGDRTEITIYIEASPGLELLIHAPDSPDPVGRGSEQAGLLVWSGRFPVSGVYHAIVSNPTPGPIQYTIEIEGDGVAGFLRVIPDAPPPSANVAKDGARRTLTIPLPPAAGATIRRSSPPEPADCTPAAQLPPVVTASLKLCPQEIYPPFRIVGSGIGLFGDDGRTAVVNSSGRQFAITVEGSDNWIDGIVVQSSPDPADAGAFMCQYEECVFPTQPHRTVLVGGLAYGGGILVNGSNTVIHNVRVRGGTIGVATVNGRNNLLAASDLSHLNGWGSFNLRSVNSYYVGNTFNHDNHACTTPDGFKFEHGCETAGWVCLACTNNLIARNHCEVGGNCYYMSGERGLGSNSNRFVANYCAGAPNNCFEFTFSKGNILQDNIATSDTQTGAACKYPFWIGGSTVYFGKNTWECSISPETSLEHAIRSTTVPTIPLALGDSAPVFTAPQATATRPPADATTEPTRAPSRCRSEFEPALFFSWTLLSEWANCILQPSVP
jgi:hypothetical protein